MNVWDRLQTNLCLGGKDEYHMGSPITYCKFELAMVRCKEYILEWRTGRRSIYGLATQI